VGEDWPSGVYAGVLVEGDGSGPAGPPARPPALDAHRARLLFVVGPRPGAQARVLFKVPLLTYHACNLGVGERWDPGRRAGGWCLYSEFDGLPLDGLPAVPLRRPGGGTGAATYDASNPDPFDLETPRQTFAHWDARALGWLEREGVAVDVCCDLDLHERGAELLRAHRLLLSVGHDEYWSAEMRTAVETWVAGGGNAAFLGGSTSWWRVTFDDPWTFRRAGRWSDLPAPGRPENAMRGVSFRNGGERPLGADMTPVGFRVQHADHPLLAGTGLRDGDAFGDGAESLVGYECDGAHFRARRARPPGCTGRAGRS